MSCDFLPGLDPKVRKRVSKKDRKVSRNPFLEKQNGLFGPWSFRRLVPRGQKDSGGFVETLLSGFGPRDSLSQVHLDF